MRVLLIWPRNERASLNDDMSCCEPLGLEYLAGALRDHHDVEILDERLDPPLEQWAEGRQPPDVVGVAIPFTASIRPSRRVSRLARSLWPSTVIVLGGHHPTVSSEWMDGFAADWVVAGEGGLSFRLLLEAIERRVQPPDLAGLASYEARGEISRGSKPAPSALQELPMPDRTVTARHRGSYFHSIYRPVSLVRFSTGCPYHCNFCSLWRITERRYLVKESDRILQELHDIDGENVYVVDDEAFIQPARMLALADAIEDAGLSKRYHMYVRTDTALRRQDIMERWASIGLDSVLVGAESMTDHELVGYEKGTSAQQTQDAINLFHQFGVKVRANFIVDPSWGEDGFDRLERTISELGVDLPSFSVLTPLPGTNLYDESRRQIVTDDPDMFDLWHSVLATRLAPQRFHDRLAGLFVLASGRSDDASSAVFYYGNDDAFDRMVRSVRDGWDRSLCVEEDLASSAGSGKGSSR
jgi:methyltransferase